MHCSMQNIDHFFLFSMWSDQLNLKEWIAIKSHFETWIKIQQNFWTENIVCC